MRLSWTFCTVIVCSLLATNVFTSIYLYQVHRENLLKNYQNIGETVSRQIESDLSAITDFAKLVCFDSKLQSLMRSHLELSGYPYYQTLREINSTLSQYVTLQDHMIDDIYIVDREGTVISRNGFYLDTPNSGWYQTFLREKANFYFTDAYAAERRDSPYPSNKQQVFSCVVNMFDLNDASSPQSFMGRVIINIKYDTLSGVMGRFEDVQCGLYRQDGSPIAPDGTAAPGQSGHFSAAARWREGRSYYFSYPIPLADWTLVACATVSITNSQMLYGALFLSGIMFLVMYLSGKAVVATAKNITEPLKALTKGIRQFSTGDFNTHVDIASGDEVEEIAVVFNNMVDKIREQMAENVRKEREKRNSEMRFLMAQIKPHFIYNSLNCIIYLARCHRDEDIIQFTRAFISLLQASIRTQPQQEISLFTEIENVRNYMILIQYRYHNAPDFQWKIDEDCYGVHLPGLVLIPIVENSIFHGFLPKEKPGHILLIVEKEGQLVRIMLEDDGDGIPADKLEELRRNIQGERVPPDSDGHIGLFNISERLKYCENASGTLHIESREGQGTRVWFHMKCGEGGTFRS